MYGSLDLELGTLELGLAFPVSPKSPEFSPISPRLLRPVSDTVGQSPSPSLEGPPIMLGQTLSGYS